MKKIVPYSKEWYELELELLRDFSPGIYPCKKCGGPVASGYICMHCGDMNPSMTKEQEEGEK